MDSFPEDRQLGDFYREFGVSWEKTLRKLSLPTNVGIVRTMTLREARALAVRAMSNVPVITTTTAPSGTVEVSTPATAALDPDLLETVQNAIRQEVAASKRSSSRFALEIDAIRHVQNLGGRFVYRLVLSSQVNFNPEQTLQFQTRATKETIVATVITCDDEGLVVASEQAIPTDAKLFHVTFDPSFIYKAIGEFLESASATNVSELFLSGSFPPIPKVQSWAYGEFNEDQAAAIAEMTATPIHLLWGPPGTGKTTTLGEAGANWLRQRKRVLICSTSNAAVDVAMKALLKRLQPKERQYVLRLGTSLDPSVSDITLSGKLSRSDWKAGAEAHAALERLNVLTDQLSHHTISQERYHDLYAEAARLEGVVSQFHERANALEESALSNVLVTGCTLAKLVLDKNLRSKEFDIVVIDEASMASAIYALAASTLAENHLVLAGDPKQLPPICQSAEDDFEAQEWFGKNVYDWFGLENDEEGQVDTSRFSVLRTQYRMTESIGNLVSRLSYGNILRHARSERGAPVEFVDVPVEWDKTYYSVAEKSYYHLGTVPLVHKLTQYLRSYKEVLLLSPFRPQRSLLSALAFDLGTSLTGSKITASTIHRAQGSEGRAVILDLTTHDPDRVVAFFRDRHCANLLNVGFSRAQDRLIIIGSRRMLRNVHSGGRFMSEFAKEIGGSLSILPAEDLLVAPLSSTDLCGLVTSSKEEGLPAIYSHPVAGGELSVFADLISTVKASRKLFVLPDSMKSPITSGDVIVRHDPGCPPVLAAGGIVGLPTKTGWVYAHSPNVSRVLWRIGFSHLADEEVDPRSAKRFFCPECFNGDLVLKRVGGEGWFLVCSNQQVRECAYRRRLSLEDAKLKVRLTSMTCPDNHPLTARTSSRGIFLGCENYPTCQYTASLALLDGV